MSIDHTIVVIWVIKTFFCIVLLYILATFSYSLLLCWVLTISTFQDLIQ